MTAASRESIILMLWRQGYDTSTMARALKVREAEIANTLARIRDEAHK